MTSLRLKLTLLVLLLLVAGCNRTTLLYDHADWLAERWADDLIAGSEMQRDSWRALFAASMDEHTQALLPELILLLRGLERGVASGITPDTLDCLVDAAERVYRDHARWAIPPSVAVLYGISPQQVDHLAAQLERRNEEYRADFLQQDPDARERERLGRYVARIERWVGELSTDQVRLVEEVMHGTPDVAGDWLDYRSRQQQRLLALLRARADERALKDYLAGWWVAFDDRPAVLVEKTAQLRRAWLALIIELQATLRTEQRAALRENLADVREGLEVSAERAGVRQRIRRASAPCADREARQAACC